MSAPRTASALSRPTRTPMRSAAARRRPPPGPSGKRMSQAAMAVTPSERKPAASAWPASPKPMNASAGCDMTDLLEAVQPGWILHQDLALQDRLGRHAGEEIDQVAVVRHVLAHVGMRPVGAPQDAPGRGLDERARERQRVVERRPLRRDALRAADLDPEIVVLHK